MSPRTWLLRTEEVRVCAQRSKRFLVCGLLAGLAASVAPALGAQESSPSATYDAKNKRDPFVPCVRDGRFVPGCGVDSPIVDPIGPVGGGNPQFKLEAIVWDPAGSSLAIINGAVVTAGQRVSDFVVKSIQRDSVTLSRGEESLVLQISFENPNAAKEPEASIGGEEE